MEGVGVSRFQDIYRGTRALVTGDSGFKGSWLAQWLTDLGAEVFGLALPPDTQPNHTQLLQLPTTPFRGDLADYHWVQSVVDQTSPQIVFHLAAQPLVRRSYRQPLTTWTTNVLGTAHLLEACRIHGGVQAIVVVTTDKVYENHEWPWGYRENDRLGGHDPYSASKAAAELVAHSYRAAFFEPASPAPLLATARAGNVIGGGDWAEDRLIPDIVRATTAAGATSVEIRSPAATRPWQHVLECLAGYLLVGQRLLQGDASTACAWNFGPEASDNRRVGEVLQAMQMHWPEMRWHVTDQPQPHEAQLLYLDSSQAKARLGWRPVWSLAQTLQKTAEWYRALHESQLVLTRPQIEQYMQAAAAAGCEWAQ
jgi:CDP-glucose 4,6-dehydratase